MPSHSRTPPLVFDACNAGVVLRAVLFVQAVVSTAAMFGAESPPQWLLLTAWLTSASLPGTLAWLMAACGLKHALQRMSLSGQYAAGVLLGALAGLFACALLRLTEIGPAPWLATTSTGALLAALLVTALVLRARGRAPADTRAQLSELQSRIRPHFLFNTLNSAIALVREEPAKAEAILEDLCDLFRGALAEPHSTATLAEEIELARRYLAIEQVRFGERLQVQWQLDPDVGHALLPPLLLQPLVENAVRHGVEPGARGGKLQVRTEKRGSQAVVRIVNTLPDKNSPPNQGHGIALANVRARLSLLHDMQSSFSTKVQHAHFVVRIALPLPTDSQLPPPSQGRHAYPHR
ncbi:sensor histidine kinase [Comamonas composti]|uniref:sensor histidine kinase n=1 Tax=Comamonas composti TaxID=408558 RepID=UPI001FE1BE24|nr:histidine kinase [Comamonas composti]